MQAKGFIRIVIIALIVVALYQLSFSFLTGIQEKKADKYAISMLDNGSDLNQKELRTAYLDSIKNVVVFDLGFVDYTYSELQDKQLGLGLDLKGGIAMLVEIDQADVLKKIAKESTDPAFNQAVLEAKQAQADDQGDFLSLFLEKYEAANPQGKLSSIFAPVEEFRDKITWETNNADVLKEVRKVVTAKVEETHKILVTRIDEFGVSQPFISEPDANGRIYIELPGAENTDRVRKIIQSTAILEFYETVSFQEIGPILSQVNDVLIDKLGLSVDTVEAGNDGIDELNNDEVIVEEDVVDGIEEIAETVLDDSLELDNDLSNDLDLDIEEEESIESNQPNPLFDIMYPNISDDGSGNQFYNADAAVGYVQKRNLDKINEYLNYEEVKSLFPANVRLVWSAKPTLNQETGNRTDTYILYALKVNTEGDPILNGEVIVDAGFYSNELGQDIVTMQMSPNGADQWQKITRDNIGKQVAIVLDNKVFSAPNVESEISGGNSQISGMDDLDEAKDLANILKSGKLEATINIPQESVVGATLGEQSKNQGLIALAIGLLLVILFMLLYYSGAGIIAVVALLVNLVLILGFLSSYGAALTLPGMAGIVLTIGMAVDANVIIFERIREELRKGKGLRLAISDGFSKSYAAIIDANVTTFIAGAVLLWLGRGPVQGFAIVLLVGIVASLVTAVLLSRLIFDGLQERGKTVGFSMSWSEKILTNTNIDFLGKRKIAYAISAVIIVAGLASMFTRGFELGVDFKGGRSYVVEFDKKVSTDDVREALTPYFDNQVPVVKTYGTGTDVQIITSYEIENNSPTIDSVLKFQLFTGLGTFYDVVPEQEEFIKTETFIKQSNKVDTSIADDIKISALKAGLVGALLIFLYILFRFRKWQFGVGALGAVIHDILIMLGLFSLLHGILPFSMEIEQKFIAAILTIIGYSINDTVVVFDRIREYFDEHPSRDVITNVNTAINSTLSRTLMTSLTTFLVVAILFVFGGTAIRGFAFALLIGVLVGTYSSIFIASSIVVDTLKNKLNSKK